VKKIKPANAIIINAYQRKHRKSASGVAKKKLGGSSISNQQRKWHGARKRKKACYIWQRQRRKRSENIKLSKARKAAWRREA